MAEWLSTEGMNLMNQVQIQDEAICISFCANALKKGQNPSLLLPAMGK